MLAIAIQTALSLILCFAIGFATAWLVCSRREEEKFQSFFANWRARYDELERDCDRYMSRISELQRDVGEPGEKPGKSQSASASSPIEARSEQLSDNEVR